MSISDSTPVLQTMKVTVGDENVTACTSGYAIDGVLPAAVVFPNDIHDLSRILATAYREGMAVSPWGGGTRVDLGNVPTNIDAVIDLRRFSRVVHHNHGDLTVTVQAGITLNQLGHDLAEHGQFLALDAPLADRASIGGTLAVGQGGLLKWQWGSPRDLVIGMVVVQADGTVVKSGGQVVKNVSGYDMARLHVGGLGTLGVIAEVSFKLTPLPLKETTLVAKLPSGQKQVGAGLEIFHSSVLPLALVSFDGLLNTMAGAVSLDGDHLLAVRLGGRPSALARQIRECTSIFENQGASTVEALDCAEAATLWRKLSDFGWHEDSLPVIAARTSVPPSSMQELHGALACSGDMGPLQQTLLSDNGYGTVLIRWFNDGNCVPPGVASQAIERARGAVHSFGGRLTLDRCPIDEKQRFDVWDSVDQPLSIMRRMKGQYDPRGILNPGRFVGGI